MSVFGFPHRVPLFWTWATGSTASTSISISGAVAGKRPLVGYIVLSSNLTTGTNMDIVELTFASAVAQFALPGCDDGNVGVTPFVGDFTRAPFVGAVGDEIELAVSKTGAGLLKYNVAYAHMD